MAHYILCADDFALSPAISETIAALASKGHINAISCMASMPGWAADARMLDGIGTGDPRNASAVQIGIHLVLAGEVPLTSMQRQGADGRLPSADRTMMLAYAQRLDLAEIAREIDAQFAAFRAARGRAPDFVDTHQHVHVFPGIRRIVIEAARRHAPGAWMRNPGDRLMAAFARPFPGKAIGSNIHATGFRAALARAGIDANDSFAGHYDYRSDFRALLPRFFRASAGRHLIMCHPGAGRAEGDGIAKARVMEAEVLRELPLADRLVLLGAADPS